MSDDGQAYVHPQKIVAAGALFTNEQDELLLVNPTYKWQWEIPGGLVEAYETPLAGCIREVKEEIDLDIAPTRLLGVDHIVHRERQKEILRFVFWGGMLTSAQIETIRLPDDNELSEFGFFSVEDAQPLTTAALGAQLARIVESFPHGTTVYAEHIY